MKLVVTKANSKSGKQENPSDRSEKQDKNVPKTESMLHNLEVP